MTFDRIKRIVGGVHDEPQSQQTPEIPWVEAANSPWGIRVLDVRPVTLGMLSTSSDPRCAANALSFNQDDGTSFIGEAPQTDRRIPACLRFPIDRVLADGVLFIPRQMEHKWAIFYHRGSIICVRGWQRKVWLVASVQTRDGAGTITEIHGTLTSEDEEPSFTTRALDYLLQSHALGIPCPVPLPAGMDQDPKAAAWWCMSLFGNLALAATSQQIERRDPEKPLRTHSLLHIAVARADTAAIEAQLTAGVPIDLLAADGLAPLHWALASRDPATVLFLLDRGSPVDVRSDQGATPLMNAVQAGDGSKVSLLLDRGADVNARDRRGFTSLHRAAEMGHIEVARLLLDRGAAPNPEADGHTPKSFALDRKHTEIVALLDARG